MRASSAAISITLLAGAVSASSPVELLAHFVSRAPGNPYGLVSVLEFETGVVRLPAKALAYHAHDAVKSLKVAEPVWVIGYRTWILDSESRVPQENYLCHTFFGNRPVVQPSDPEVGQPPMSAVYSDAFTGELDLPEGFGVRLAPEDNLEWMPMFNNRGDRPAEVRMKGELRVIRERDLQKPLRRLYCSLYSVKSPHLYFVPPGRHQEQATFELPFDGRIHFIATHIHPYGECIELRSESRHLRVWKSLRKTDTAGRMTGMQVYSSVEGYPVRAFDAFRLIATYDNPTPRPIDAMAGIFLFYSRD